MHLYEAAIGRGSMQVCALADCQTVGIQLFHLEYYIYGKVQEYRITWLK